MRTLILLEFLLAYFVPTMFLGYGVVFGIFLLYAAAVTADILGFFGTLYTVVAGSFGMWASVQLLSKLFNPNIVIASPNRIKYYMLAGVIALILATYFASSVLPKFLVVAMLLPIPVAIHLVILHRGYLWSSS